MTVDEVSIGGTKARVTREKNAIHIRILTLFTDEAALAMTTYLDGILAETPGPITRIWDATMLSAESFKLTAPGISTIGIWGKKIFRERPGSKVYFIAPSELIFGLSRMYQILTDDEGADVEVLHSVDELPTELRQMIRP